MKLRIILATLALALAFGSGYSKKEEESYNFKRGKEAVENYDFDQALNYFERELAENPKNGKAYTYIAGIRLREGEYGKALTAANNALKYLSKKDSKDKAMAYDVRALTHLALEDTTAAISDYKEAINLDKEEISLMQDLAEVYYNIRDYEAVEELSNRMMEIDPGDTYAYMAIGRNRIAQDKPAEAEEFFNRAILLAPDYAKAYAFRAEAYIKQKKYGVGIDDLIKSIDLEGDPKALYLMYNLDEDAVPTAITKLQIEANKNPNSPYWYYIMGGIKENNHTYNEAIKYYQKAYDVEPLAALAYCMARCNQQLGNLNAALSNINDAINMMPEDADNLYMKALILGDMGRSNDAISAMDEYIMMEPENPFTYYGRAVLYMDAHEYEKAIEDLTIAITLDPKMSMAYLLRGRAYDFLGKSSKAREDYLKIIELDTADNGSNENHYAYHAYALTGEKEKGIESLDKMLEQATDKAEAYYDAACFYSNLDDKEKAVSYLTKALESGYHQIYHLKNDRDLDNIRNTPEYKALLEKYDNTAQYLEEEEADIPAVQTSQSGNDENFEVVEVPFTKEGGITKVECSINGLPLHFYFDTGASDVTISLVEANFMLKNNFIKPTDIIGSKYYVDANGDITEGTTINLRNVNFGGLELDNVRASVVRNQKAPLLLGQSVLGRLGKIEIDNKNQKLVITQKH